jgi:Ca2+-binding EF-hand superfamily protein
MDKDGSRTLFLDEFRIAFQRCNLNFTDQEITTMFYQFDANDKKYIDYEEFMIAIRGPISYRRRQFIDKAFQLIDFDGRGMVDPEEIIDRYDPTNHPDVKNGLKKSQDIFRDFLRVFDVSTEVEGKVTRNEFENYYFNLSASIERDDYFGKTLFTYLFLNNHIYFYIIILFILFF